MRPRLAALALLLLALAACRFGGTRPIIKIGLSAPFTGSDESVGYSVIGAVRLAVRERNQSGGGAGGYSIELVALDDDNDAQNAAQRAREMIGDPAVMAVLGGFDEFAASAAAVEYERAGMPFIAFAPGDTLAGRSFRLLATEAEAGRRAGDFAVRSAGARRIAVIDDGSAGEIALSDAFAAAAHASGATIAYRGQIKRWQLDFAQEVRAVAAAAPDLLFFAGRAAEGGELLRQMRAAGVTVLFLGGPRTDDARLAQIAGQAAQGAHYVSLGFALPQASDAAARERLAAASLRPAGAYTVLAYDGTQLVLDALASAIKATGKPSRSAVADALRAARHRGLSGEISFNEQGSRQAAPAGVFRIAESYPGVAVR